jgi:hypothetical protein
MKCWECCAVWDIGVRQDFTVWVGWAHPFPRSNENATQHLSRTRIPQLRFKTSLFSQKKLRPVHVRRLKPMVVLLSSPAMSKVLRALSFFVTQSCCVKQVFLPQSSKNLGPSHACWVVPQGRMHLAVSSCELETAILLGPVPGHTRLPNTGWFSAFTLQGLLAVHDLHYNERGLDISPEATLYFTYH